MLLEVLLLGVILVQLLHFRVRVCQQYPLPEGEEAVAVLVTVWTAVQEGELVILPYPPLAQAILQLHLPFRATMVVDLQVAAELEAAAVHLRLADRLLAIKPGTAEMELHLLYLVLQ